MHYYVRLHILSACGPSHGYKDPFYVSIIIIARQFSRDSRVSTVELGVGIG